MNVAFRAAALVKLAAAGCVNCVRKSRWKVFGFIAAFGSTVHAEEAAGVVPPNQAWLQAQSAFVIAGRSASPKADDWLAVANEMRAVQAGTPTLRERSEAKTCEALALIKAAELAGAVTMDAVTAAVTTVKSDANVSEENRFAVASRYRELQIEQAGKLDLTSRMAAYEASARAMIKEFPGREEPYTALAALAEDQPDAAVAEKIVTDFRRDEQAPQEVRVRLEFVRRRDALVGTAVDWVDFGLGEDLIKRLTGRPVLICTRTSARADSLAMTEWLTRNVPDAMVLAILDLDSRKVALHDRTGGQSGVSLLPESDSALLAERLLLDRAPMIYLIDHKGRIRFVRALQDLPAKLRTLGEEVRP